MKKNKVIIVIPAYNSELTLKQVFNNIPKGLADEVIIADDGSKDHTVREVKKLGLKPILHKKNLGYGANQKTLYSNALKQKADYFIMLHPDGQYDPTDLPKFVNALKSGKGDLILGSRFLSKGDKETPGYKSLSLKILAFLFNLILRTKLTEVNTGYRGYTRQLLETVPFSKNGNGYIFDPQFLIQTVYFGFKVAEVPVLKKYNAEASSPDFFKSLEHGLENIQLLVYYILQKMNIRKSSFLIRG